MTWRAISVLLTLVLAAAGRPIGASSDAVAGLWRDAEDSATVNLVLCADGLCGDFVRQPGGFDLEVVGGFRRASATRWEGGRIYNLNDGATYIVDVELLDPESLKVRACWLAFCETRPWRRLE